MPDLDRLEQLARLRDQGTLTQEEFIKAKQDLLEPNKQRSIKTLVAAIGGIIVVLVIAAAFLFSRGTNAPVVAASGNDQSIAATADNTISAQAPEEAAQEPVAQPAQVSDLIAETAKFTKVGQCKETQVAVVGTRLEDTPGSGTAITYTDGTSGFSYETVNDAEGSKPGDHVKLCLTERPKDCPAGSDPEQGSVFSAENNRTGGKWSLPNSSHECGGA